MKIIKDILHVLLGMILGGVALIAMLWPLWISIAALVFIFGS
jgi:hypothetical protein